jgi:hypothetical protein
MHVRPDTQGNVEVHFDSDGNRQAPGGAHWSPLQSFEDEHWTWHLPNAHTRSPAQSLLIAHPEAS